MKNTAIIVLIVLGFSGFAQVGSQMPIVDVKTMEMQTVSTSSFKNDGKPIVLSFWATWCKPAVRELSVIAEKYEEWQGETGVKVIAISIDNARSASRLAPFISGKAWEYEIYLDPNEDFKKAMKVVNIPHTFLINSTGKVVWQHTSYVEGDEEDLYEKIQELLNEKPGSIISPEIYKER